jgi:sugar/nucleoside kinase (ribokinase family)
VVPASSAEALDVTDPATGARLARAQKLFALREGLIGRHEISPRSVTTELGKTVVYAAIPDGSSREEPGLPVAVVNGLGAGDAFAAGSGHALLRGHEAPAAVANAAGAIVAARHSCAAAMPTLVELEAFLESGEVPPDPLALVR